MTEFEYFMTLVSVILAIGISEFISGWSRLLAAEARPRIYPLFPLWGIYVFFMAISVWIRYWPYQQIELVGYKVLLLLAQFLAIVFAAHLLTPRARSATYDMAAEYWRLSRLIFPTLSMMFIVSIPAVIASAELTWRADQAYIVGYSGIVGGLGLVILTPAFVRKAWYHWCVAVAVVLLTVPDFLYYRLLLAPGAGQ